MTRPLVNVWYAIDRALWGPTPFGFRAVNIVLHMANVALLYVLAWGMTEDWLARRRRQEPSMTARPQVVAFTAAVLLAVHPMMTQAVGYISGRAEVLCGVFFLLALLSARQSLQGRRIRLVLTAGFWFLALCAKESAAMFPAVILACDLLLWPGTDVERRRRLAWLHAPLLAVGVLATGVRLAVLGTLEHGGGGVEPHWRFALVELDVVRRYLTLILAPTGQAIFHAVPPLESVLEPRALLAMVTLSAVVGLAWRMRRAAAPASVGMLWFLLLLVPAAVLVVLDRGEPMAEHRVYVASFGLFLAAGVAVDHLTLRLAFANIRLNLAIRVALLTGLMSLAGRTVLRNIVWADPVRLWAESADKAPDHWLPYVPLGEALHNAGRHEEAVAAFLIAVRLRPQEESIYGKLGVCLIETGRPGEAAAVFEDLRKINPQSGAASYGLGVMALAKGLPDEARRHLMDSLARDPSNIAARQALAALEESIGDNPGEALRYCEEVRQMAPDTPGNDDCIRRNQGRLATQSGHR